MLSTGNRSAGFTLIEVLVTVTILLGGLMAVVGACAAAVDSLDVARETVEASLVLRTCVAQWEEAAVTKSGLGAQSPSGSMSFTPGVVYQWAAQVSPADGAGRLSRVRLSAWREGSERRQMIDTFLRTTGS